MRLFVPFLLLSSFSLLPLTGFTQPARAAEPDNKLHIYWIDTEGGAATLVITPTGESVLIDTGNPGRRDADRIMQVATRRAGLVRIDHLITTHFHRDHFGGAATLASLIPIGHVHDNGRFEGMPDPPDAAYWSFPCDQRSVLSAGDRVKLKPTSDRTQLDLVCLGARKQFVKPDEVGAKDNREIGKQHKPKDRDGSDNANSIVLLLSYGDFRFFDGGDLTWNQEAELVNPFNLIGEVDVYQVTHHGLDASNNPIVLQTVKPTVAVMNNGHTKGCSPDVFADLSSTPSIQAIFQVHKNLRPDGAMNNAPAEFIANHEAADKCSGHPIHMVVDAGGAGYTIEVESQKLSRSFKTKLKR